MASGDTLFVLKAQASVPPGANAGTIDWIADASTPAIHFPCVDLDGVVNESVDWHVTIPSHYTGTTGFTFRFKYAVDGSDVDIVGIEFRVLPILNLDILTADLGMDLQTEVEIQDTPASTPINKFNVTATGALAKAAFGSAVAGDDIVVRATRDTAVATNTDDLQLITVYVTET